MQSGFTRISACGSESPIARFIEKRGEGIHHICLRVDDLDAHLGALQAKGYRLINEHPVPGAHGCRVAFLHPNAGNGVLIELSQPDAESDSDGQKHD